MVKPYNNNSGVNTKFPTLTPKSNLCLDGFGSYMYCQSNGNTSIIKYF